MPSTQINPPLHAISSIPKLPVFGWQSLRGPDIVSHPSVLDISGNCLTTSGQAAIDQALEILQVGSADRILIPSYHPPSILAPVVASQAQMVFYPIDQQGNARLEWLEQVDTRNIKAMFAVHFFGLPRSLEKIRAFCDTHGIALIEDCAHSLFGMSDGQAIGTWGDISIASLTKFLPVLEGGVIASTRRNLPVLSTHHRGLTAEAKAWLDLLETGAQSHRLGLLNPVVNGLFALKRSLRGGNTSNAPSVPALASEHEPAVDPLLHHPFDRAKTHACLTHANRWTLHASLRQQVIDKRRAHFNYLLEHLSDVPGIQPLTSQLPDNAVPYVFPALVKEFSDLRHHALRSRGIPLFRWGDLSLQTPVLPGDEGLGWARSLFQLPCHQDLDEQALQFIVHTVRDVCSQPPRTHSA